LSIWYVKKVDRLVITQFSLDKRENRSQSSQVQMPLLTESSKVSLSFWVVRQIHHIFSVHTERNDDNHYCHRRPRPIPRSGEILSVVPEKDISFGGLILHTPRCSHRVARKLFLYWHERVRNAMWTLMTDTSFSIYHSQRSTRTL
jgi:hypothetical protein